MKACDETGSCGCLNSEDYCDLLMEQHEHDVVMLPSRIDITETDDDPD